jgi:hypothetical protein
MYGRAVDRAQSWEISVQSWIIDNNRVFKGFSSVASATFLDDAIIDPAHYVHIHFTVREKYKTLTYRLSNLRSIMERPDVYF